MNNMLDNDMHCTDLHFELGRGEVESLVLPCEPFAPALVRSILDVLLPRAGLSSYDSYDVKTAVGEAISNAIRHGCNFESNKFITFKASFHKDRLIFEIGDQGPGFQEKYTCSRLLQKFTEGGMGIELMKKLMDNLEYDFESGTRVRLTKFIQSFKTASS